MLENEELKAKIARYRWTNSEQQQYKMKPSSSATASSGVGGRKLGTKVSQIANLFQSLSPPTSETNLSSSISTSTSLLNGKHHHHQQQRSSSSIYG